MNTKSEISQINFSPQVVLPCRVGEAPGLVQWTRDGFALGDSRELPGYPRYQYVGDQDSKNYNTLWPCEPINAG